MDQISFDVPKTRDMVAMINAVAQGDSALVLLPVQNENAEKSANNLQKVKALRANYLNVRDLLGYEKVIMPVAALELLSAFLADDTAVVDAAGEEE